MVRKSNRVPPTHSILNYLTKTHSTTDPPTASTSKAAQVPQKEEMETENDNKSGSRKRTKPIESKDEDAPAQVQAIVDNDKVIVEESDEEEVNVVEESDEEEVNVVEESDEDNDNEGSSPVKKSRADDKLKAYYSARPHRCHRTTEDGKPCTKAYKFKGDLTVHVRLAHDKRRDYICRICGDDFQTESNLKRHIKSVHDNIRDFKRDICEQQFKLLYHLRTHKLMAHGIQAEGRVKCTLCSSTFESEDKLQIHTQSAHRNNIVTPEVKITTTDKNLFSDSDYTETSSHDTGPINDRILNVGQILASSSTMSKALMVSVWKSELDQEFSAVKVVACPCPENIPNYDQLVEKSCVGAKFKHQGNEASRKKLTCSVMKDKSFYFQTDLGIVDEIAKTSIVIVQSYLDLLRTFPSPQANVLVEGKYKVPYEYSTSLKLKSRKEFLDKLLLDNKITWLMECREEYLARKGKQGKTAEQFKKLIASKYVSKEEKNLGTVYMVHTRINDKLFLYIGTRKNLSKSDQCNKDRRLSSTCHKHQGTLHDLMAANPEAEFFERTLFYLDENEEPKFPVGESIAIFAFYLMEQSVPIKLYPDSEPQPFHLINLELIMPRWDRDFIFGLRKLIHKFSGRRFSLTCEKGVAIPKVLNINSVFSVLGAKKFN